MTRYRNLCHCPGKPEYGPEFYDTDAAPNRYHGADLYRRLPHVWDVVALGECVAQMAGFNGAKRWAECRAEGVAQTLAQFPGFRVVTKAEFFAAVGRGDVRPAILGAYDEATRGYLQVFKVKGEGPLVGVAHDVAYCSSAASGVYYLREVQA